MNSDLLCAICNTALSTHKVAPDGSGFVCPPKFNEDAIRAKVMRVLQGMSRKERRAWCRKHKLPYEAVADRPKPAPIEQAKRN